jgi:hypothetical protein
MNFEGKSDTPGRKKEILNVCFHDDPRFSLPVMVSLLFEEHDEFDGSCP